MIEATVNMSLQDFKRMERFGADLISSDKELNALQDKVDEVRDYISGFNDFDHIKPNEICEFITKILDKEVTQ